MRLLIVTLLFFCSAFTLVVAPSPNVALIETTENKARIWNKKLLTEATDLAKYFSHVPEDQRKFIGDVPSNLYPLIKGADHNGRLLLPKPEPGHAMLLTQPTWGLPGFPRNRGVGIVTTPSGETYYSISAQSHFPERRRKNLSTVFTRLTTSASDLRAMRDSPGAKSRSMGAKVRLTSRQRSSQQVTLPFSR